MSTYSTHERGTKREGEKDARIDPSLPHSDRSSPSVPPPSPAQRVPCPYLTPPTTWGGSRQRHF
jgi:hypothetical protein